MRRARWRDLAREGAIADCGPMRRVTINGLVRWTDQPQPRRARGLGRHPRNGRRRRLWQCPLGRTADRRTPGVERGRLASARRHGRSRPRRSKDMASSATTESRLQQDAGEIPAVGRCSRRRLSQGRPRRDDGRKRDAHWPIASGRSRWHRRVRAASSRTHCRAKMSRCPMESRGRPWRVEWIGQG